MGREAIILAGGLGTRLRPAIGDLPKPLAPVMGRPFIDYLLETLGEKGFTRVILATGYKGNLIRSRLGDSHGSMKLIYSQESEPLGTGGAIALAMRCMGEKIALVLNGDTWLETDFDALEAAATAGELGMAARYMGNTGRYGRLKIEDGRICGIVEKNGDEPGWINAGCYGLPISLCEMMPQGVPFSFERDFLPDYMAAHGCRLVPVTEEFWDIGMPDDYMSFINHRTESRCS